MNPDSTRIFAGLAAIFVLGVLVLMLGGTVFLASQQVPWFYKTGIAISWFIVALTWGDGE